ncbi:hypothetical protein FIBSPDRAFT_1041830 [Athelia psychrophila]|uniref:Uncharacterized protein n=1 Tax=Athelia psychrophila TaxID=1759441 RepID=A0A166NIY2_9AGAM|nr:hypothetical protein FIBSPDRAFT_1041830 [Fibularhizoctonia sp. CBS 109695]
MTQNLLPIRILFHSAFALVYLPTIALAFAIGGIYVGYLSLSALAALVIFAALDILTIRRKVNQKAVLCIDILVAIGLPGCVWPLLVSGISEIVFLHDDTYTTYLPNLRTPLELTATFTVIGLSTLYVLYIVVAAVVSKVSGNAALPRYPDESPLASPGTRRNAFLGRQRTATERAMVIDHCTSYIFQRSIFRKHAFEPTGWAIFRGTIAVYCCVGLLLFAAYEGYSEGVTYGKDGMSVQERVLASAQVESLETYLSVAMLSPSQPIPSDLKVARPGHTPLTQTVTASDSQFWSENAPLGDLVDGGVATYPSSAYPFIKDNDFNVSWSGDVTVNIWITTSGVYGSTDSIQALYTPGFRIPPFKEYDIALIIISYEMNNFEWLFLEPHIETAAASGSNTTTARFSCSWQTQRQITHRDLTPPSGPALFAQALSAIGGAYAFIDGVFALIFGRTMLAILFGSKSISPFGLLGIITRARLRHLINEQYPRLQEDIERGGMAAYISEVAVDPGLVLTSNSPPNRVAAPSQVVHTGDDAEVTGLIPLRPMERSNGNSSHLAQEDCEPSRKHSYE